MIRRNADVFSHEDAGCVGVIAGWVDRAAAMAVILKFASLAREKDTAHPFICGLL